MNNEIPIQRELLVCWTVVVRKTESMLVISQGRAMHRVRLPFSHLVSTFISKRRFAELNKRQLLATQEETPPKLFKLIL